MASRYINDIHDQTHQENETVDMMSTVHTNGDGFKSFQVVGLASDQNSTPTGMRDEILLLCLLIVLLRTQEDGQIFYEWAYKGRINGLEHEPTKSCLSMNEVMTGLESTVGQVAAAISCHITKVASSQRKFMNSPVSLLLSTSCPSLTSKKAKDEVSEQFTLIKK